MHVLLLMVCVNFDREGQLLRSLLRKLLEIGTILQNSFLSVKVRSVELFLLHILGLKLFPFVFFFANKIVVVGFEISQLKGR